MNNIFLALLVIGAVFMLPKLVETVVERETTRQEAVAEYNCDMYREAINKHAGREVCAPTPNG